MEESKIFEQELRKGLPFEPTSGQSKAIVALGRFLATDKQRCAFLLKGYAGTGKTSLMKSMVRTLEKNDIPYVCLAPTGRAAKVLASYTQRSAFTIHKHIYKRVQDPESGIASFLLAPNRRKNMVYIVDEASMIGDTTSLRGKGLLDDLIEHIYSATGCKLLLIGDEGQLPPVHLDRSPAMDLDFLRATQGLLIAERTLDEVVRQAKDSGILEYATRIRERILENDPTKEPIHLPVSADIQTLSPMDLPDVLQTCYDRFEVEGVKVICRSNKDANSFNHQIRNRVFYYDEQLSAGELLMVVRNNYLWMGDGSDMPFIANGEMVELQHLGNTQDIHEHHFSDAGLRFMDQADTPILDCKMLLDVLDEESASLSEEKSQMLYESVKTDLSMDFRGIRLSHALRKDPYINALQVKYGYAVTCHKAQGGQWPVVIIYQGYLTEEMMDRNYWRWLYTAVTRATDQVYIIQ